MDRTLLLVTGAGRSGTSTVAGTLALLGAHVPGPHLGANRSNPKGFYESRWSVDFHTRLLDRARTSLTDGRPDALLRLREVITAEDREELRGWLAGISDGQALTVVKDPRTVWTLRLFDEVAAELGLGLTTLTMLRHPAEVLGSRNTYYAKRQHVTDEAGEADFRVRNLAGWLNATTMAEQQTRGGRRSFVRYADLLTDWRGQVDRAARELGLDVDLQAGAAEVDAFVDPDLSRHRLTWADTPVPASLRDVADRVWDAVDRLADAAGADPDASGALDAARDDYATMYADAKALVADEIAADVATARRAGARAARRKLREQGRLTEPRTGRRWWRR